MTIVFVGIFNNHSGQWKEKSRKREITGWTGSSAAKRTGCTTLVSVNWVNAITWVCVLQECMNNIFFEHFLELWIWNFKGRWRGDVTRYPFKLGILDWLIADFCRHDFIVDPWRDCDVGFTHLIPVFRSFNICKNFGALFILQLSSKTEATLLLYSSCVILLFIFKLDFAVHW